MSLLRKLSSLHQRYCSWTVTFCITLLPMIHTPSWQSSSLAITNLNVALSDFIFFSVKEAVLFFCKFSLVWLNTCIGKNISHDSFHWLTPLQRMNCLIKIQKKSLSLSSFSPILLFLCLVLFPYEKLVVLLCYF